MPGDQVPRACAICAYPASHRCAGCAKAFYCSKEHQKTAWGKHKRLCKMYQAANKGEPMPAADTFCGLCGRADGPLRQTDCCNRTVCSDYDKYQMFTYSANSCARNHDRYTRCAYHCHEDHDGDVFSCEECNTSHEGETATWYSTNNFNFLEDIERTIPIPFVPATCTKCGRSIKLNCDGVMYGANGKECMHCGSASTAGISAQNTYRMDEHRF